MKFIVSERSLGIDKEVKISLTPELKARLRIGAAWGALIGSTIGVMYLVMRDNENETEENYDE